MKLSLDLETKCLVALCIGQDCRMVSSSPWWPQYYGDCRVEISASQPQNDRNSQQNRNLLAAFWKGPRITSPQLWQFWNFTLWRRSLAISKLLTCRKIKANPALLKSQKSAPKTKFRNIFCSNYRKVEKQSKAVDPRLVAEYLLNIIQRWNCSFERSASQASIWLLRKEARRLKRSISKLKLIAALEMLWLLIGLEFERSNLNPANEFEPINSKR